LDVCSNGGAKREMGGTPISNGGPGTTGPPAGDGPAPHGLHGLTVLEDETTEWLLNTCPEI